MLSNTIYTPNVGSWGLGRIDGYPISGDITTLPFVKDELHPAGHSGVDIAGYDNAIHCPEDGVICDVFALPLKGNQWDAFKNIFGNCVIIDHGDKYSMYAHLRDAPLVREGQLVKAGDVLGYVGNTGYSFGPHLHWAIAKHDNRYFNFPPEQGPEGILLNALDYCKLAGDSEYNSTRTTSNSGNTQSVNQINNDFIRSQLNAINDAVAQIRNNL